MFSYVKLVSTIYVMPGINDWFALIFGSIIDRVIPINNYLLKSTIETPEKGVKHVQSQ